MLRNLCGVAFLVLVVAAAGSPIWGQEPNEYNWGKDTPGFELATHEGARERSPQGTVLIYNLIGKGFPTGVAYKLWGWAPGKSPRLLIDGVSFDKRGLVICASGAGFCPGSGKDDPVNIKAAATRGEAIRLGVVSNDGKTAAFAEAVPFPIEAADKNCKVSVVRQSVLADTVQVRASGFTPYELLTVTTLPNGSSQGPTVSAQGTWTGTAHTEVSGQTGGTATVKVSGHGCSVSVSFAWGEGSDHRE